MLHLHHLIKKDWKKILHFASKLRFWHVAVLTSPLLIVPGLFILLCLNSLELKRVQGWPDWGVRQLTTLLLHEIKDATEPGFYAKPNASVPTFDISVQQSHLDQLDTYLPLSGFQEKKALLQTATGYHPIKLRYRGDNSYHWFYAKKSWRVKTRKREPLTIGRKFSLVNPKDEQYMVQHIDGQIAQAFGLLSSPTQPIALNINRIYQGIYILQYPADESFLRNQQQMPGNIYVGDTSTRRGPSLSQDSNMTANPYIWRLKSVYNGAPPWNDQPLVQLIKQMRTQTYWRKQRRLFDEQYMARFCAFISFVGTSHYDTNHNLKLFFEPLSGQFQMIEGDSIGLTFSGATHDRQGLNITSNLFFATLLQNPIFTANKNQVLYDQINNQHFINELLKTCQSLKERYQTYVQYDTLDRQSFNFGGKGDFAENMKAIRSFIKNRAQWLNEQLAMADLGYIFSQDQLLLTASGNSPVDQITLTFNQPISNQLKIYQRHKQGQRVLMAYTQRDQNSLTIDDRIYPGSVQYKDPNAYAWYMQPAPLAYLYQLDGLDPDQTLKQVAATNTITQKPAAITKLTSWQVGACDSIHPWDLPKEKQLRDIVIDQKKMVIEQDWIIDANTKIIIAPGTTLQLAPGVSILCYGQMMLRGTKEKPIIFKRLKKDQPWGMLALQGQSTAGSQFQYVDFDQGSTADLNRVRYSGMVNVHHSKNITFSNCRFIKNTIGDDTLHVAKAQVDVLDCSFVGANSDAIDYDYAQGLITRNHFTQTGNDAIDLMTSDPIISHNLIQTAGDKGISIGENSNPLVFNNTILHANIGVEIKDQSSPIIINTTISQCKTGIHSYAKNWRYHDGGHGSVYNSQIIACDTPIDLDKQSDLQIYNSLIVSNNQHASDKLAASPRTTKRLTLVNCVLTQDDAKQLPAYQPIYKQHQLATLTKIGSSLKGISEQPKRANILLADYFTEDFTTYLQGWSISPTANATKRGHVLSLEPRYRQTMRCAKSWKNPLVLTNGQLTLEAQSKQPTTFSVLINGHNASSGITLPAVTLNSTYTRHMLNLPQVPISKITLQFESAGRIDIRMIQLTGQDAPKQLVMTRQ